jgi:hypothetical protein
MFIIISTSLLKQPAIYFLKSTVLVEFKASNKLKHILMFRLGYYI